MDIYSFAIDSKPYKVSDGWQLTMDCLDNSQKEACRKPETLGYKTERVSRYQLEGQCQFHDLVCPFMDKLG